MLAGITRSIAPLRANAGALSRAISNLELTPMDGNTAAAHVAYHMSDSAFIYPITPASPMSELCDSWYLEKKKNIYGEATSVTQLQSEAGASAALHGALTAGACASTFTSSQGLLLMYPNMFEMAGELLPATIHLAMRALNMQGITIFSDHSDAMAVRPAGFCELIASSVQETMDMSAISHSSAFRARLPFLNCFEGFRVSHEVNTIYPLSSEQMLAMQDMDAVQFHRDRAINPENPHLHGNYQQNDVYMQMTEYNQMFFDRAPMIVQEQMDKLAELTGRQYHLFDYEGHPEAEAVIVAMGSGANTVANVAKFMNENQGKKVGVLNVRLFRPFSVEHFREALPPTVKKIAVIDRTIEWGATGEPLYLDTLASLQGHFDGTVIGGRYGIGGREFTQGMVKGVFDNLEADIPKTHFTVGINDDVRHKSLDYEPLGHDTLPEGTKQCLFWAMGSDGTVGANKTAIKVISKDGGKYGQAHFEYSAHKSGGMTISHLRFGPEPINAPYILEGADYVACHQTGYLRRFDTTLLKHLAPHKPGTFVLNSPWDTIEDMEANLSNNFKRELAEKHVTLVNVNATGIAEEAGMKGRINVPLQAVFFKLSEVLPEDQIQTILDKSIVEDYGKLGPKVIASNQKAAAMAMDRMCEIKYDREKWLALPADPPRPTVADLPDASDFIKEIYVPINEMRGEELPVSAFAKNEGSKMPHGTTKYEKRGIAEEVPYWDADACSLQCHECASQCPHSCLRPFYSPDDMEVPEGYITLPSSGVAGHDFRIQVSPYQCTGCGICSTVCPVDAITMEPLADHVDQDPLWEFGLTLPYLGPEVASDPKIRASIKGSQFHQPLVEFNGACAGCAQPTYVKLLTQLFGEELMLSNASGCTSVWSATFPMNPFTTNHEGFGPTFAWSLFEDGAEYGYGQRLTMKFQRMHVQSMIERGLDAGKATGELKDALVQWSANFNNFYESKKATDRVRAALEVDTESDAEFKAEIEDRSRLLAKKSLWVYAGDGWAYDIGYGGVDHVIASGDDMNILVLDSEVYSNTGGQSSKASPRSAITKFQAHGKNTAKKDLGLITMTYKHAYVASIAMGAKPAHAIKTLQEAEAYDGPSLVMAYCPCIEHGVKGGLYNSVEEQEKAVESGYWLLYRYDPRLAAEGKNPLQLDSKPKLEKLPNFLLGENRFENLKLIDQEMAEEKQALLIKDFTGRWEHYQTLAGKDPNKKKGKKGKKGKKKQKKSA